MCEFRGESPRASALYSRYQFRQRHKRDSNIELTDASRVPLDFHGQTQDRRFYSQWQRARRICQEYIWIRRVCRTCRGEIQVTKSTFNFGSRKSCLKKSAHLYRTKPRLLLNKMTVAKSSWKILRYPKHKHPSLSKYVRDLVLSLLAYSPHLLETQDCFRYCRITVKGRHSSD